jgi:hypothetical protein
MYCQICYHLQQKRKKIRLSHVGIVPYGQHLHASASEASVVFTPVAASSALSNETLGEFEDGQVLGRYDANYSLPDLEPREAEYTKLNARCQEPDESALAGSFGITRNQSDDGSIRLIYAGVNKTTNAMEIEADLLPDDNARKINMTLSVICSGGGGGLEDQQEEPETIAVSSSDVDDDDDEDSSSTDDDSDSSSGDSGSALTTTTTTSTTTEESDEEEEEEGTIVLVIKNIVASASVIS